MSTTKKRPKKTAAQRWDAVHKTLCAKLGRLPTAEELARALKITTQRTYDLLRMKARELGQDEASPTEMAVRAKLIIAPPRHRRCELGQIPEGLGAVERIVVVNMQRVYAGIIARPDAPGDAELAARAGFKGRPDQNALEWRRYIEGGRVPSLEKLGLLAHALGVHPVELLRPEAT